MPRIVLGLLAACVLGQGVYVIRLSRAVARLSERTPVAAPAVALARHDDRAPRPAPPVPVFSAVATAAARGAAPVASAPLLEVLGRPEGRQKLAEVLASLKEERRAARLLQSSERRDKVDEIIGPTLAGSLGLSAEESTKVQQTLSRAGAERRAALEQLQRGKSRAEVKAEIDAANRTAEDALKNTLGDKRMLALRDLRRKAADSLSR
jgi:hypothetical protein